ncbi:HmuY family protein [Pedobacter caeni]|uniref:HmuY protein n=1 Tax=Pedobacter caeni TaxID=288992 RepID=A0A1M5J6K6_9SPHI|nr:HmuY family protein [Pedobacter caeni]SHG35633.1 hypothetical protein SAMN04488522_105200 [Pedobacter caeni]
MNKIKSILFMLTLSMGCLVACKKDKTPDPVPEPEFVEVSAHVKKYKNGTVVVNRLPMPDLKDISTRGYFNFDKMAFVDAGKLKTKEWDIVFEGLYAGTVFPNNGNTEEDFPWFGNAAKVIFSGIVKPFDEVTALPDNFVFPTGKTNLSTAESNTEIARTNPIYWGYTTLDVDGGFSHFGVWKGKTFLWKLDDGRVVKFELINVYNNAPEENNIKSVPGYLSFRYFIGKAGSKDLKTN